MGCTLEQLMMLGLGTYAAVMLWMVYELVTGLRIRKQLLQHKVLTNQGWIDKEEAQTEEIKLK